MIHLLYIRVYSWIKADLFSHTFVKKNLTKDPPLSSIPLIFASVMTFFSKLMVSLCTDVTTCIGGARAMLSPDDVPFV